VFLTVEPYQCAPVQEASIAGPATLLLGQEGTYTATYAPITATQPVTFTWDSGTVSDTAVYSWTTAGIYALAVTATNECGAASDTLTVTVSAPCEPVHGLLFDWTPLFPTAGQVAGSWRWEVGKGGRS
jgi:hypothetical protein